MSTNKLGVALLITVGVATAATAIAATTVPSHGASAAVSLGHAETDGDSTSPLTYSPGNLEFYLTEEEKQYVRPGLTVEIVSVEIPADRHPVVEVTYVDDQGLPLDREGRFTPGTISMSFVIAWYDADTRHYTAYTTRIQESPITGESAEQASSDSGGTWDDLELGRSRYTFGTELPEGYDMTRTHTVYVYGTRNTEDILGKNYYSDPSVDFRPDGGDVTETWAKIFTDTCNGCHDPLALHGSRRRSIRGCVTCHNPQSVDPDTGNTVDMKVMIHKIHRGANLPSVQAGIPYIIIGFRQSVHDYSDVVFPQDIRNCWNCHSPDAPQGSVWFTYPARASCGSCHDDIDWETGENHAGGPATSDDFCANCHPPEGNREFDASVIGGHTIPTKSSQLAGLNMEIVEVTDTAPGSNPMVSFAVTNDDGSMVDISTLDRMRLRWGGPTQEYLGDFQEDAFDAVMSGDVYVKTLTETIPADATGTWAFSADVYRNVTIQDGTDEGREVREAAFNPIFYAPVTDDEAVPRRDVVSLDSCNRCHDVLSLHGGQRFRIEECLICHRPDESDAGDRPEEEFPPESVHFKYMIHRIHTGAFLDNDFTVYGFGNRPHNYNKVVYPGDRRNCVGCHVAGTYGVPLPEGTLETPTLRDWYTPMQPAAAACLSCHSSVDAAAHAFVNTAPFGESCAACHGDNREFSVDRIHAR
jgi:OmcA/MtrC family decaheme c-type cytochrome